MTIVSMGREPGYPKTKHALSGGGAAVLTHSDRFKVVVSSEALMREELLDLLPSDYELGEQLGQTLLKERSVERDKDARKMWYLDLLYSSDVEETTGTGFSTQPDLRPAKWGWDFETVQYVLRKDVDTGLSVMSSSHEPFEIVSEFAIPVLTVERFESFFDPGSIINYVNRRNGGTFWTADPGVCVCTGIRDREGETYQGFNYRLVTYNFKFMVPYITDVMEGAKEIVMDVGNRFRPSAGAAFVDSRTKVKLNTDGTKLADTATPLFKKFNKCPAANFDDLGVNNYQL